MINAELTKRGLTETEVKARLLQKGIDLENIPPAELPKYQERVTAVLDELEAEKKQGNKTQASPPVLTQPAGNTNITIETGKSAPADTSHTPADTSYVPTQPAITKQEAEADAVQQVIQEVAKKSGGSSIYGHSVFIDQSLKVFRTTDGAQAPETYVLGDGDEIRITIFGASQTDIQQKISAEGSIQPTGVAKIFLKGLTLAQAREVIKERLSSAYTFRSDQLAVTIITARTILINVFGESKITGGFNISALNSALNALSAAGGPTEIGSVRNIQLIRGNARKTIDLYAFMNDPAIQYKFDLQQNDILFVPVAQQLVKMEGAVKRPMRYEMLPNETLADLIKYAGGINVNTYPDFVQIERISNGEVRLQEWNLTDVLSGKTVVPLQNGDIVRTREISKPIEQYVEISGSLFYPGRFDLTANPTLDILLKNAQPTPQAKMDLIFVERIRRDLTVEQLSVNWISLRDSNQSFKLYPRDKVIVTELANFRDVANISVTGHVRSPFEKSFAITDHITLKQAIEMAGGLKIDVYPIAYVLRYNLLNPKEKKYLRLELGTSNDFVLLPGDHLMVFDKNTFTETNKIAVAGFVRNPIEQTFAFTDRISVKNALELAGGLKAGASNIAYIFRRDLLIPQKMQYIRVELDKAENIQLQPGDQLNVYDSSLYINNGEVQVSGAVKTPRSFIYDSSLTIPDILTASGGFVLGAAFNRVEVFRTHIYPKKQVKLELITLEVDSSYRVLVPSSFILQPYDHIIVRQTPAFTMGRFVEITGEVFYPGIYQLDTKQTQLSAIIKKAGGLLPSADAKGSLLFRTFNKRGSVTIDIVKAMRHRGNKKIDPILFEGDVININRLENTVSIESIGTRLRQEGGANLNIVYQGNHTAKWYVKNYAGGFIKDADKNSVTVTLKNGQMKSTKSVLWLFKKYPLVETGATVSMHLKPPKEPKAEGSKVNWNDFWTRTVSATTVIVTLLVMAKQL